MKSYPKSKTVVMLREVLAWCDQYFDLDMTSTIKMRVTENKFRSRGGVKGWMNGDTIHKFRPWISINTGGNYNGKFREYASIAKHPEIGTFEGTHDQVIMCLIVHEVAHVIDYFTNKRWCLNDSVHNRVDSLLPSDFNHWANGNHKKHGGHGARWQRIYGLLRRQFVNGKIVKIEAKATPVKVELPKKAPKPQKVRALTTGHHRANGREYSTYRYHGEIVAIGFKRNGVYTIFNATPEGKLQDVIAEMSDGRRAKGFMRNMYPG